MNNTIMHADSGVMVEVVAQLSLVVFLTLLSTLASSEYNPAMEYMNHL